MSSNGSGGILALEADRPAVELEVAPGEIIVAAHQVGAAGEARRVGEAADVQAGRPAAVDPEADHLEVAARKLEIELPGMKVRDLDHVLRVDPGFADIELRDGGRGARPAELEAALVEMEVAGDRAAVAVRADLQRTRHPGGDVVAVEQQRLVGFERQVEQSLAAGEGDRAAARHRPVAGRLPGDLREDQLRPGEARLARNIGNHHAGDRAFEARVLGFERAVDDRVRKAAADVRAERQRARHVDHFAAR